ncbi:hypothetical protein [Synechococcus phage Ssp-JY38]|nr:acetylornithine aminotransferase [Synechococcus phage Yong-L2-223]
MRPIEICRGNGDYVYDTGGNAWLDFRAGIMTATLGHGHPAVTRGVNNALTAGLVNSYTNHSSAALDLMALLIGYAPDYNWKLLSTGVEAIDRALQLVSKYLNRAPRVAALRGGFHGKTMHIAPVRWDNLPWRNPLGIQVVPPHELDEIDFDVLLYEPIQSLTGVLPNEMVLRQVCSSKGAFLVADEMVTGFMRTGKRFASTMADIIVAGKGLGQGLPLSTIGIRTSSPLAHVALPVDWSTTAAANNLCAQVGLAVLQWLIDNEARVKQLCAANERRYTDQLGAAGYGNLGFMYIPRRQVAAVQASLQRHRILATIREDGIMRLGPSFFAGETEFTLLQEAIECGLSE